MLDHKSNRKKNKIKLQRFENRFLYFLSFKSPLNSSYSNRALINYVNIIVARDRLIQENRNFKPPKECSFNLSGKPLKAKMIKILEKLYNEKVIMDHGMQVGKELANVLSGGDTNINKTLTEDDLYKLELDSFMRLIETKETQERIKYTLKTGKPLIN